MAAFLKVAAEMKALLRAPNGVQSGAFLLCMVMIADVLTGLLCALMGHSCKSHDGGFSWKTLGRGLLRKLLMLMTVYLAALLDGFVGLQGVLRGTALWFYIGNEGLSVMENLMHMGVPVPKRLRAVLMNGSKEQ